MLIQVQVIVYGFCQSATNPVHLYQVIDAGTDDALQSAKLPQQFAALFGAKSGDLLQPRGISCFGASLTMPRNGETMRFVPNLLYQKQCR